LNFGSIGGRIPHKGTKVAEYTEKEVGDYVFAWFYSVIFESFAPL
jgi:hypothetical protein